MSFAFFFFNDTATTEIYTLSLHDALPISGTVGAAAHGSASPCCVPCTVGSAFCGVREPGLVGFVARQAGLRSEEHTSELQSLRHLVCRLLLEKKKSMSCI